MEFIKRLLHSLESYSNSHAFFIDDTYYTYKELNNIVSAIRLSIRENIENTTAVVGLLTHTDIYTYASILAVWLEGKAYMPLNPSAPISRNEQIITMANISHILDSYNSASFKNCKHIATGLPKSIEKNSTVSAVPVAPNNTAYILYTSGSTGMPKGVPITFSNLNSFVLAIDADPDFNLTANDKCLQMFELTFDFSVVSLLLPLLSGACVYTIPDKAIKYFHIIKLLKEKELTVISLVPSMVHYLRPYFSEIFAPKVKYCSFGGSKLEEHITTEWSSCIPNAKIINYYGPTECTIYSTYYYFNKEKNFSNNGVLSIGKPLPNMELIVVDEKHDELLSESVGELCIAGPQVTPGYWKNAAKNKESFFTKNTNGVVKRYYKSGDLCYLSKDGYYMYVDRKDFQVKIRGYRVELGEVEFHAKELLENIDLITIDVINELDNTELALVIKAPEFDIEKTLSYLKEKLPNYMVPTKFLFLEEFPHNSNGKIDRKAIRNLFN